MTALNPVVAVSGTVWLALGIAIYALYRRRHGLDLVTTAKIAIPRPVTASEAEYESVLIALEVDHFTRRSSPPLPSSPRAAAAGSTSS